MNNRLTSVLWTGGFLLALALIVYLIRPEGGQIAYDVKRTSFRTSPDGVAALYRGIERLGTPVAPRMTPLVDADPIRGTLVVLEPTDTPSPREVGALLAWVRDGGALVYAPRFDPASSRRPQAPPPVLDSLGLALRRLPPVPEDEGARSDDQWAIHPLTEGLPQASIPGRIVILPGHVAANFDAETQDSAGGEIDEAERPRVPSVPTRTLLRATAAGDADSLEGDAVAEIPLGEGRLLVFADAAPLSNANAGDDPMAALAVRAAIAYTAPGDTVFFDEFHHGVRGLGSPAEAAADFFFGSPGGRALFHLGLVAFLAVAVAGVRLGAPADPPRDERRSPLEHVSALGALYRRAEARETAALLLISRLAQWARTPPPRDVAGASALLDALERRETADDGALQLRRIRSAMDASPIDLIAVAAGIDAFTHTARRNQRRSRV